MTQPSRTVHIVGDFKEYEKMFTNKGEWMSVDAVEDADLVVFCGGEDVWPGFYGEKPLETTGYNINRDYYEKKLYTLCLEEGVPCVGICRGAQFLHTMNGGQLFQHVDNHAIRGRHEATIIDSRFLKHFKNEGKIYVTSTHHQQMHDNVGDVLLASWICDKKYTEKGLCDPGDAYAWDVEALYHDVTKTLCYQPHPEMCQPFEDCQKLFFLMVEKLLLPSNSEKEDK